MIERIASGLKRTLIAPLRVPCWGSLARSAMALTFISLGLIVLLALTGVGLLREQAIDKHKSELSAVSLMLAEDARSQLVSARLALNALSSYAEQGRDLEQQAYRERLSGRKAHDVLLAGMEGNTLIDVATFVDVDGTVMNFTRSFPPPKINLSDRDYFQNQSIDRTQKIYYSLPVPNRGTGKWVFYLSRRIESSAGQFRGLVLVGVSVAAFSSYYERIAQMLGPSSSIALYRDDLTLMTRWPLRDELVGKRNLESVTADVIGRRTLTNEVVLTDTPRFTDRGPHQAQMSAPRRVPGFPFIVTPVMSEENYLLQWRYATMYVFALSAFCILTVLPFGLRLQKLIIERERALATATSMHAQAQGTAERLREAEAKQRRANEAIINLNSTLEARVNERTQALALANADLEAYSYSIAHDLRTPLRVVAAFSHRLVNQRKAMSLEEAQAAAAQIQRSSMKMGSLIDGLLEVSRSAKGSVVRSRVNLSEMATQIFTDLTETEKHQNRPSLVVSPEMMADGDPALVMMVLQNLVANAVKYSARHPNPLITIGIEEVGGRQCYFVRDNGTGFDMEHAAKLFMPFQRLHGGSEFQGIGIGLATCKRIIDRHGGSIWAEAAPGQGATFYFTLSASPASASALSLAG